ncbi:MAG: hypothetical protein JW806_06705 [Sedimentisphaerales bacterium]|nr:hypothetical protein [Sedimentisphaerales bacterium]
MKILLFCIALFFLATTLSIGIIKMFRISNQLIVMLAVFFMTLAAGLGACYLLNEQYSFLPAGFWENLQVLIFYLPVMFGFIFTYVGLGDDSPSMTMAAFVEHRKDEGCSLDEFKEIMNDDILIMSRLRTMTKSRMIVLDGDRYKITKKGKVLFLLLTFWPKILKLKAEG